jgi:hypothetical protein
VTSANGIANLLSERSIATPRGGMWTARSVLNLTARLSRTQAAQAPRKLAKGQRRPGLASGAIPSINQGTRDQLARIVAAVAIVLGRKPARTPRSGRAVAARSWPRIATQRKREATGSWRRPPGGSTRTGSLSPSRSCPVSIETLTIRPRRSTCNSHPGHAAIRQ